MRASRDVFRREWRAIVGVIATGVLLGASLSIVADANAADSKPAAAATKPAAAKSAAVAKAKPQAVAPAAKGKVQASAASSVPSAKVKATGSTPAVRPSLIQALANVEEQVTYQYNALGRRDPFQAMVGGEFVGEDVGGDAPVDVGGMTVVGIVWGADDKFALAEDGRGNSLVLRPGDKVMNGVVESLKRDAVVVRLTMDGQTQSVTIPLTRKGDRNNAQR
jgi:hypothetical protein